MANEHAELLARASHLRLPPSPSTGGRRSTLITLRRQSNSAANNSCAESAASLAENGRLTSEFRAFASELRSSCEKLQLAEDRNSQHLAEMQSFQNKVQQLID